MTWILISIVWYVISILYRITNLWSYANTIETAVLLVILYDIFWHRWNALREIKRDEEAESRLIEREQALEKRQVRRERQEVLRRHWQDLQGNLLSLHRVTSHMVQLKRFVEKHKDSQDATVKQAMLMMANRVPVVMAEFGEFWGRTVAQLNVFPQPRDALVLEVLKLTQEIGKTVGDSSIEIKDETLLALAELVPRVSDPGTLPNLDEQ